MLARLRKARQENEGGFTLIELLVVVIIIGILAAIAIPTFLNQREKAWQKAAQSDLRNSATVAEEYFSDNGTYVGLNPASHLGRPHEADRQRDRLRAHQRGRQAGRPHHRLPGRRELVSFGGGRYPATGAAPFLVLGSRRMNRRSMIVPWTPR
jgi:prepilin-type N-terminal cleavage/methylation domain-containing protein